MTWRCVWRTVSLWAMAAIMFPLGMRAADLGQAEQKTRAELVRAHLAAGEYGLATKLATQETDLALKGEMFQWIAEAQLRDGAVQAAAATLRNIPDQHVRGQAQGRLNQRQTMLQGGAAMADFGTLMQLIQQNTSGQWEDQDGVGGTMTPFPYGVRVAPERLLAHTQRISSPRSALQQLAKDYRRASVNEDLQVRVPLRVVSLRRLEEQVAERLAEGLPIPAAMHHLAGIVRLQYIFVNEAEQDILLAGPAEGWVYDDQGRAVGAESGSPCLSLDDFVVVWRTFWRGESDFGCSINTRAEGIRAVQEYVRQTQHRPLSAGAGVRLWVRQLQLKLGAQDVVFWGIPADSHAAQVLFAADYRMKLIGIDKLDAGKEIPSYFDLLAQQMPKNTPPMEALRWWLSLQVDAIEHTPDGSAWTWHGQTVRCLSENQMLTEHGEHLPTGQAEQTNRLFAENFTRHYDQLAQRDPVFAEARNIFDLALACALIQREKLAERAHFSDGVFGVQGAYRHEYYAVPREIDSVVNHRVYGGRDVVVQVAGGVRVAVNQAVQATPIVSKESSLFESAARTAHGDRWWWDVAP
ncbi:MAG: hypothetical protein KatS3mg113_0694 [Planctomycetaceae bacterium]|nr:MAG: hypothetical protein KatS3mg113_0694 [Planctomycetaceae bacterium]